MLRASYLWKLFGRWWVAVRKEDLRLSKVHVDCIDAIYQYGSMVYRQHGRF